MKALSFSIVAAFIILSGCKKSSPKPTPPAASVYLLEKATYVQNGKTSTNEFTYDSKNRVTRVFYGHEVDQVFTFTYNTNNQLLVASSYKQDGTTLIGTSKFTYTGTMITDSQFFANGTLAGKDTLFLNSNNQVVKEHNIDAVYGYDGGGNLTSYSLASLSETENNTYDQNKNPLSMMGATNNYLMFYVLQLPESYVNNVLTTSGYTSDKWVYSYKYNTAGFPVSATVQASVNGAADAGSSYTISFEYYTK